MTYTQWLEAFEYSTTWKDGAAHRLTVAYPEHYDRYLGELLGSL